MRLYLTIQRHGLPITRVLWTTAPMSAINATTASASSSFTSASSATLVSTRAPNAGFGATGSCTIAQLLEDVNEVVPLETDNSDEEMYGGQWGLEDYTVEIGGYECLHFMEVDGLFRDGDEVLIRALQTSDLKARRLTGRHQISADGRHLIDGVPFGKPYIQRSASSRPSISIPPRKRRRLTFGGWNAEAEDHDEEYTGIDGEDATGKELALVNRDSSVSSMDDYDAELESVDEERQQSSAEEDEDEESLDEEIEELKEESRQAEGFSGIPKRNSKRRHHGSELDDELRGLAGEMQQGSDTVDQARLDSINAQLFSKAKRPARHAHKASSPLNIPTKDDVRGETPDQSSLRTSTPKTRSGKSSIAASTPRPRKDDKLRESSASSPPTTKSVRFQKSADIRDQESSSEEEASDSESEEVSVESNESGESSDSDDSDDSSERASVASSDSDQDSVSSSSSSSSSDSSPSPDASDEGASNSESDANQNTSSFPASKKRKMNVSPKVNPPGHGTGPTKSNNRRGKMRRRLVKMKSLGILHPDANFADLRNWEATHDCDPRSVIAEYEQKNKPETGDEQSEFEAKRQQLLESLSAGGVNVDEFTDKENVPPQQKEAGIGASTQSPKGSIPTPTKNLDDSTLENVSESARKRMRLDVAGSRRLLFGSLGVRTPKTKEDEEDTRKKLAGKVNDAHIASQRSLAPDHDAYIHVDGHEDEFDGDWEDKLVLKATECIHDDVPLSTPPFPFVQRWDEDAQATIRERKGIKKGRKRKRGSRHTQEEQVEEDNEGYFNGDDHLNYDDLEDSLAEQLIPQPNEPAAGDLPIRQAGDTSRDAPIGDDLPTLPNDLSEVAGLTKDDVKTGAIVAFKQLDMSKATNWQPEISEYRVASIESVNDDTIQLCLSRRDRKQRPADNDDEDDGPRTYSKFEMPGDDDDEDNAEDDGLREVTFDELIEPKLLRGVLQGVDDEESSLPSEIVAETQDVSLPAVKSVDVEVGPISSPTRDNISQLIQDAGFRSKIDSDLMGSQENFRFEKSMVERAGAGEGGLESLDEVEGEDREESAVPSPGFSGFLSSPPRDAGGQDSMDVDHDEQHDRHEHEEPGEPGGHDEHDEPTPRGNSDNAVDCDDSLMDQTTVPESTNDITPRDPIASDILKSIAPSSDGLQFINDDQNDIPESPVNDELSGCPPSYQLPAVVEESILENRYEEGHSEEDHHKEDEHDVQMDTTLDDLVQEEPNKEDEIQNHQSQLSQGEGKEEGDREDQSRKSLDRGSRYQDSLEYLDTIPPLSDLEESQDQRPRSKASSTVTNPCYIPNDDSQFDFPPVEELLASTAPVRGAKSPKATPNPKHRRRAFSSPRKAPSSPDRSPSPALPAIDNGLNNTSPKPEPEPSQAPPVTQSSNVVDLTLSSDPVEPPAGSDDEFVQSPGLPGGPGWVQKRTSGRSLRKRSSGSTVGYGYEDLSDISPPRPRRRGRPRKYSQ